MSAPGFAACEAGAAGPASDVTPTPAACAYNLGALPILDAVSTHQLLLDSTNWDSRGSISNETDKQDADWECLTTSTCGSQQEGEPAAAMSVDILVD